MQRTQTISQKNSSNTITSPNHLVVDAPASEDWDMLIDLITPTSEPIAQLKPDKDTQEETKEPVSVKHQEEKQPTTEPETTLTTKEQLQTEVQNEKTASLATQQTTQSEIQTEQTAALATEQLTQSEIQTEQTAALATEQLTQSEIQIEQTAALATEQLTQSEIQTEQTAALATKQLTQSEIQIEQTAALATEQLTQSEIQIEQTASLTTQQSTQSETQTELTATLATEISTPAEIKEYEYKIIDFQPITEMTLIQPLVSEEVTILDSTDLHSPNEKINQEKPATLLEEIQKISLQLKQKEQLLTELQKNKEKIDEELLEIRNEKNKIEQELSAERDTVLLAAKKIQSLENNYKKLINDYDKLEKETNERKTIEIDLRIKKEELEKIVQEHPKIENTIREETSYIITLLQKKELAYLQLQQDYLDLRQLNEAIKKEAHQKSEKDQQSIQMLNNTIADQEEALQEAKDDTCKVELELSEKAAFLHSANLELEHIKNKLQVTLTLLAESKKFTETLEERHLEIEKIQEEDREKNLEHIKFLQKQLEMVTQERDIANIDLSILKGKIEQQKTPGIEQQKTQREDKYSYAEKKETVIPIKKEEHREQEKPPTPKEPRPSYSAVAAGKAAAKLEKNSLFHTKNMSPTPKIVAGKGNGRSCFTF